MSEDTATFDLEMLGARVDEDAGAPEFPALAEALRRTGSPERAREVAMAGLESAPSRLAGRVALALAQMDLGEPEQGRRELEEVLDEMLEPWRLDTEPEAELTPIEAASTGIDTAPVDAASTNVDLAPASDDMSAGPDAAEEPPLDSLGESEIDAAFAEAESRAEEMHSPNTMAERVLDAEAPVDDEASVEVADPGESTDMVDTDGPLAPIAVRVDADDPLAPIAAEVAAGEGDFDVAESDAFATATMAGLLERQGDHGRAESIRGSLVDDPMAAAGEFEGQGVDVTDELELAAEPVEDEAVPIPELPFAEEEAPEGMDAAMAPPPMGEPEVAASPSEGDAAHRARVVATLERWLHNLGRGA